MERVAPVACSFALGWAACHYLTRRFTDDNRKKAGGGSADHPQTALEVLALQEKLQLRIAELEERLKVAEDGRESDDASPRKSKLGRQASARPTVGIAADPPADTHKRPSNRRKTIFDPSKDNYKFDRRASVDSAPAQGCWLRIITVNDVYDLKHLPYFDGVVRHHSIPNTITMLPGDFLAPGLLSSLDKGKGMVDCMNRVGGVGIQYVCFGNHETDVPYPELLNRIQEFQGCWINSNMPDFDKGGSSELPEYKIIEVEAGGQTRRIGLIGLLTVDKNLYQPGAFGGAMETAKGVCSTAAELRKKLIEEHSCDLVIPMTHQVMADDRAMAELKLGFPLIVGGHDHEPYVERVGESLIVKTGMDAENAAVIDIFWADASAGEPTVTCELVRCDDYRQSTEMQNIVDGHNKQVLAMEKAYLCEIPAELRPLSSVGVRNRQATMGTLITSFVRDALAEHSPGGRRCEGVIMDAGCIRAGCDYAASKANVTFGDLKREVPFDCEMCVVPLPGKVLAEAVKFSRQRAYLDPPQDHGGFLQIDDMMEYDEEGRALIKVDGKDIDFQKEYSIGLLALSLNGMNRNQPLIDWANANHSKMPAESDLYPAKDLLVRTCSELLVSQMDFSQLKLDPGSGLLDVQQIQAALSESLGGQAVPQQMIDNLMQIVDANHDGKIDAAELDAFMRFFKHMHHFKVHDAAGCNLRIIQCNDVYELHNWPAYDGLVRHHHLTNTITILPGDFLAPSLLSSLDKGRGMIDCMNQVGGTGIQYVCFGNHENDVPLADLKQRIAEFKGAWINSNMPDFDKGGSSELPEYKIIEVSGGGQTRRIGLLGLLTTDKNLYQPGAFGGAMETAKGVCSTAAELRKKLIEEHSCDLVIPMTHQVMADDRAFAREKMGFPLICGAHDHEAYMEQVEGAWIVKAGMDASNALIIDIKWPAPETKGEEPTISVELVPTKDYPANPQLVEVVKKHMQAVEDMETAFLWPVPKGLQLSSKEVRRKQTSIGAAVTSLIRDGLRGAAGHTHACDGVMMDAGAVRRNFDYPADYPAFTYGDLKKEITFDSDILVVSLRGAVVNAAVQASRERAYREPPEDWGGFLQLDDGFVWDEAKRAVTHINKQPLQPEKEYKVGVLALSLNGMNRNQPLIEWANAHADVEVAHAERARAAKEVVVDCCAKQVWWQLGAFEDLDTNHDGVITVEEIQDAMERKLHLHVNLTDAQNLLNIIDTDHSGSVDKDELMRATNAFLRRASS